MIKDLGVSRAEVAGAASLGSLLGLTVGYFIAGTTLDRFGPRRVQLVCIIVGGLAYMALSTVNSLFMLYILYGFGVGFFLSSSGAAILMPLIARWFVSNLGLAMGIVFFGTGLGGFILAPLADYLGRTFNWQTGFLIGGGIILVVGLSLNLLLLRDRPEQKGLQALGVGTAKAAAGPAVPATGHVWTRREALKTYAFWCALLGFFFGALSIQTFLVH